MQINPWKILATQRMIYNKHNIHVSYAWVRSLKIYYHHIIVLNFTTQNATHLLEGFAYLLDIS